MGWSRLRVRKRKPESQALEERGGVLGRGPLQGPQAGPSIKYRRSWQVLGPQGERGGHHEGEGACIMSLGPP